MHRRWAGCCVVYCSVYGDVMKKHFMYGKTINCIMIADDKLAILFKCADGDHIAKADGDCCSNTWIESIELPAAGYPATVTDVVYLDDKSEDQDGDTIRYYGLKLVTDKGDVVIDFRNSSNGYYGGSLEFPGGYYYGGVYGQNISSCKWQEPNQ